MKMASTGITPLADVCCMNEKTRGAELKSRLSGYTLTRMQTFLDSVEKNVIGKMYGSNANASRESRVDCVVTSREPLERPSIDAARATVTYEMPVASDLGERWARLADERKTTRLRR